MATLRAVTRARMDIVARLPRHNISLLLLPEDIIHRVRSISNQAVNKVSTELDLNSITAARHNMDNLLGLTRTSIINTAISRPHRLHTLHQRNRIKDRVEVVNSMAPGSNTSHLSLMGPRINNIITISSTPLHLRLILLTSHTVRLNISHIRTIMVNQALNMAAMGTIRLHLLRVPTLVRRGRLVSIPRQATITVNRASQVDNPRGKDMEGCSM